MICFNHDWNTFARYWQGACFAENKYDGPFFPWKMVWPLDSQPSATRHLPGQSSIHLEARLSVFRHAPEITAYHRRFIRRIHPYFLCKILGGRSTFCLPLQ